MPDARAFAKVWDRYKAADGEDFQSPGSDVYSLLARVVDPVEVVYSEWHTEPVSHTLTTGEVVLATESLIYVINYSNVRNATAMDDCSTAGQPAASYTVAMYRLSDIKSLIWKAHPTVGYGTVEVGAAEIVGDSWSIRLPQRRIYRSSETYLQTLSGHLGFANRHNKPRGPRSR